MITRRGFLTTVSLAAVAEFTPARTFFDIGAAWRKAQGGEYHVLFVSGGQGYVYAVTRQASALAASMSALSDIGWSKGRDGIMSPVYLSATRFNPQRFGEPTTPRDIAIYRPEPCGRIVTG